MTQNSDRMRLRPTALSVLLVLCVAATTIAGRAADNSTYRFLRNDHGARASAMGGSFITMSNDPNLIFYNPSGLATVEEQQISFGFFKHLLDVNSGHLSYAQQVAGLGFIGAGIIFVNYGDFNRRDELGNSLGTFSANELAFALGYAENLTPTILYGVNAKFIYSGIAEATSTGAAVDIGAQWLFPESRLTLGMSVLNIGSQINPYFTVRERLPLDLKIGATIQPEHLPLLLNLNFHKLNETPTDFVSRFRSFSIGGEFIVSEEVRLRFGYNNERRRDLKIGTSAGLAGLSFGGGIVSGVYKFDYGFSSLGKIGSLHRISLGLIL